MAIMPEFARREHETRAHHAGTFDTAVLQRIEELLPPEMERTAETGCGKSTILFSNLSRHHSVFACDDREYGDESSVVYFERNPMTRAEVVHCVFGPTQRTLPAHVHPGPYDCVLLDGPHGFPFPELEYYYFYPHLRPGAILILDDVHIPTVGRLADFVQEDEMFELVEVVQTTAVFRRTTAPTFDPLGDSWNLQRFNLRRTPANLPHVAGGALPPFLERYVPSAPVAGIVPRLRRALRMLRKGC